MPLFAASKEQPASPRRQNGRKTLFRWWRKRRQIITAHLKYRTHSSHGTSLKSASTSSITSVASVVCPYWYVPLEESPFSVCRCCSDSLIAALVRPSIVILWWCDVVMMLWCDMVILWYCNIVIFWWCDDVIIVMMWWYCDVVISWYCAVVILCCCNIVMLWLLWSCDVVMT